MGLEFITRIVRTTAIVALLAALCMVVYYDWRFALGFLVGVTWSLLNLWFIRGLIKEVITPDETRKNVTVVLALIKFPVLYVAGYFAIASGWFSIYSLLIGFSLMFAVVVLKVLGRMMMKMDVPRINRTAEGSR